MVDQVQELEQAILGRANRLAAEYKERARRSRDNILREAHEKLHLREERETLLAKARAERDYRRKVQASELKLQKEMDLLRWDLIQGVLERLADKMQEIINNDDLYLAFLRSFIKSCADQFSEDKLVARVNARDLQRLQPIWDDFAKEAAPEKVIKLSPNPIETIGGLMLLTEDNRVRLDNTFEGRVERLGARLHQVIIERLLPPDLQSDTSLAG